MNKIWQIFIYSFVVVDQKRFRVSKYKLKNDFKTTAKILPLSPLCLSFENDVGTRDEFTRRRVVVVVVVF